jgi:uncharacterized protein (TIGR00255 family)
MKMPKKLNGLEHSIRAHLKNYIGRGKVDVYISYEDYTSGRVCVKYNRELAAEYVNYIQQMAQEFHLNAELSAGALSRYPEVLNLEEQTENPEELWRELLPVLDEAAQQFVESRRKEGEALRTDLLGKLEGMLSMVDYIEATSPSLTEAYRTRLEAKVKELLEGAAIEESRIATEVAIYADKICVDEETVRLRSHIENTKAILLEGGNVGRKLDFIAQEMNREANTILSKANSLEISNKAIDLKTEIEKVREQIQNIE